MDTTQTNINKR